MWCHTLQTISHMNGNLFFFIGDRQIKDTCALKFNSFIVGPCHRLNCDYSGGVMGSVLMCIFSVD